MLDNTGKPVGSFKFRQAPLGAGGFVTGLDISPDGSRMVHWTDAWNGYVRDTGDDRWSLMLREDNMIAAEWQDFGSSPSIDNGVYQARIAPSNKDIMYCAWHGYIYKTTNGGTNWARTAFAPKYMESNLGPQRRFTRAIDIHPTDPNTVIVGTNGDGVYYTTNGGTSWSAVTGLATPILTLGGASKYLVAIDPGEPATVYIHVVGTGVYRSTAGVNGTFTLMPASPVNASRLLVTSAGKIYLVKFRESTTTRLVTCNRGSTTWTDVPNNPIADQVAVNPLNLNHIVTVDEDGSAFRQSYDGGTTWTQAYLNGAANAYQWVRGDGETKWFSNRIKPMYPAMLLFDPVVNGKLWVAEGIGIGWSMCPAEGVNPTNEDPWVWHDFSRGNEELIPQTVMSSPGNPVILTCWDKPFWRMNDTYNPTNMWSYPIAAGEGFNEGVVTVGYCADYAADDPNFFVGVCGQGGNADGYSTDGGRTWTKFSNPCAGFGGWVAVSTKLNFIRTASNNGPAQYTLDGGQTWQNVAFGGENPVDAWANAYYTTRQPIAADKTRPGVFAAIRHNMHPTIPNTLGNPNGGIWVTTDGGQTWTHKFAGAISALPGFGGRQDQYWQGSLQYVPGKTGELCWADFAGDPNSRFAWSQDDGATWTQPDQNIRDVRGYAFGKPQPGQDRPALYLNCVIDGVRGIYATFDWFTTDLILLEDRPVGHINFFAWVGADLNVFGRCYVALAGHGFAVCDYAKRFTLTAGTPADTTAPTLTSPTDAASGATGATISVSTNEGNGTLYWFVSTSATPPSASALKAGTGAAASGSQAVSSTGVQNATPSGLLASTAYYTYFLHRDASGNDSAIVAADGFSTDAAPEDSVILVALLGQSNRIGRQPYDGTDTTEADVYAYVGDPADPAYQTIVAYGNGPLKFPEGKQDYDPTAGVDLQYSVGPNHEFLKKIKAKYPDAHIVAVPCAVGASSLMSGSPPSWQGSATPGGGGALFEQAVDFGNDARAKALVMWPGASVSMITGWVQGDQESTTRSAYGAALTTVINSWNSRVTGVTHLNFVIGSVLPEKWIVGAPSYSAGVAAVNAAQVDVSLSVANVIYVPGPDVRGGNDVLHYGPYSVNQTFGQRQGDSLTDITGPSVTTGTTQGGFVGTTANILLTHDDPLGHATFHFAGGADDALFEITDPYVNGTTQPQARLIDNETVVGVYELKVRARDGSGNYGPVRTIAYTQAVPEAAPVEATYQPIWSVPTGSGAGSTTVNIKAGVNLFSVTYPAGDNQGAALAMTINGNAATKLGYSGGTATCALFAYESATDVDDADLDLTWSALSIAPFGMHVVVTGVQLTPTQVVSAGWGGLGTPQMLASLTVPTDGIAIGIAHASTDLVGAESGTSLVGIKSTDIYGAVGSRTTTGQIGFTGGGVYACHIGAAFEKIP